MTTNGTTPEKKCGLVVRVSTDRQVKVEEGSLRTQLLRLRAHIEYKNSIGEAWREVRLFELKAVSGKNSLKSVEMRELHEEIRRGNVNVVLCTSLDRISRSVKDFLTFFEFLSQHGAELVCLKQNLDSTSAGGRLLTTVMLALAEFERDQTCERNRDTTAARSERGLWNGGVLLGYDLAEKKGTLVPNASDASLVCLVFEIYLQRGSIFETAKELNAKGYRTKEFGSRRGKFHEARPFSWSSVYRILTNPSYVGKKVINKTARWKDDEKLPESKRYRLVEAVWPGIVDPGRLRQGAVADGEERHDQEERCWKGAAHVRLQPRPSPLRHVLAPDGLQVGHVGEGEDLLLLPVQGVRPQRARGRDREGGRPAHPRDRSG